MTSWVRNIVFLASFVALVLAEIILSLTNLTALVAQQARTISAYETKDEVQRLRIAADATLMSTRSYILLGDAGYTQVFAQAKGQIRNSLEQLKTLMADEPSQSQRLAQIESLFPGLLNNFEKIMLLYNESGPQAAIAQLRLREDTVLAGRLNDLILKLDGEQGRLLRDRFALDTRQERQAWTLIMLGGALSVFVVFGGAFFVYRDLAQRRHMETELQQKTVLLETTFDNIEQGVAVFDKDSKLMSWSTRFVKFFDLPKGFLYVGQPYAALLRYSAEKGDFLAEDVEAYIEKLCEGLRTATNVVLASRADGRTIDIARKRMPDGSTIATYTDITDRRKSSG